MTAADKPAPESPRADEQSVKQYDAEANVEIHLVLNVTRSMTAGEWPVSKFRYATMLAAALTHLAAGQRDAVGLTLFAGRSHDRCPLGRQGTDLGCRDIPGQRDLTRTPIRPDESRHITVLQS
jgi:hypothetical protein